MFFLLSSTVTQHDKLLEFMKNIAKNKLFVTVFPLQVLICLQESIVLDNFFTQNRGTLAQFSQFARQRQQDIPWSKILRKTTGVLSDVVLKIVWNYGLGYFFMELTFVLQTYFMIKNDEIQRMQLKRKTYFNN